MFLLLFRPGGGGLEHRNSNLSTVVAKRRPRAGLQTVDESLASLSSVIGNLQKSPGRLLQSVERSSLEVWENSNSGVNAKDTTVSYYIKGNVMGLLLDAKIGRTTNGRASLTM